MSEWGALLLAHAALALFGCAAAWHPCLRSAPPLVRLAAAFACGTVALTVEASLWSLVGIPWSLTNLALPLAVASVGLSAVWARDAALDQPPSPAASRSLAVVAFGLAAGATAHVLVAALVSLPSV